jgi:NAD(P)-dependent dehydrogenase (short-subunit alcohol dehydrogenase family)
VGRLEGRVALVTGGANGIGRACCERFSEEGAAIVVADLLDEAGEQVAKDLREHGCPAVFAHLEATSAPDNAAAVATAVAEFGRLDIAVTAAGVAYAGYRSGQRPPTDAVTRDPVAAFLDLPVDAWQQVLDINLTGTLLTLQAAGRRLREQGDGGSIITIASIAAKHPEPGTPAYGVSKAGVWMLTKHAARILGPAKVRVNAVGPGFIATNMTAVVREHEEMYDHFVGGLPIPRMGTPREVANAALFLASDESSYFTGEILHPDGGFYTD